MPRSKNWSAKGSNFKEDDRALPLQMVLLYDRDERVELCYEMMALHTVYESGGSFLALFKKKKI